MHSICKTGLQALVLTGALLALTVPARAAEPDKLTPAGTDVLVVFNFRQILESPLAKKDDVDKLKEALKKNAEAEKILTAAGLDPFKDIDRLTLAVASDVKEPKVLAIVRGRFDVDKIGKLAADAAEKNPKELKISKEGSVTVFQVQTQNQPLFTAFAGKDALLASPSKDYLLGAIKNADKGPGKLSKEFQAALDKISGKESIWFAAVIPEEAKKAIKKNPPTAEIAEKLLSVTGSMNLTTDIQLTVQVQTTDAEAAEQLGKFVDSFKPLLGLMTANDKQIGPIVGELVKQLKITPEKNSLTISLKITEEMIKKMEKIAPKQ
jgi:hypothetical protein